MNAPVERTDLVFDAVTERDTRRLGLALAENLPDGAVVGMIGPLGAGKTHLVRAVAQSCGVDPDEVGSPTFVLLREYHAERTIYHFDAYRLRDEDEFIELGPEEYFYANGLSFVEWASRVACVLPEERLDIAIEITGNDSRRFRFEPHGMTYRKLAEKIVVLLNAGTNEMS